MPASQEELEELLRKYRAEKKQLLENEAKKTQAHSDRIKRMLEERNRKNRPNVQSQVHYIHFLNSLINGDVGLEHTPNRNFYKPQN